MPTLPASPTARQRRHARTTATAPKPDDDEVDHDLERDDPTFRAVPDVAEDAPVSYGGDAQQRPATYDPADEDDDSHGI